MNKLTHARLSKRILGLLSLGLSVVVGAMAMPAHAAWTATDVPGVSVTSVGDRPLGIFVYTPLRAAAVLNKEANTQWLINLDTGDLAATAQFPIGVQPNAIALNPAGSELWVADNDGKRLLRFSVTTRTLLETIPLSFAPTAISFNGDGSRLFVASDDRIRILSTSNRTLIATVTLEDIKAIGFWPGGNRAVAIDGRNLYMIHPTSATVETTVPVGSSVVGLAIDPARATAYVADAHTNAVAAVDLNARVYRGRYVLPDEPAGIAFDPLNTRVLVTLKKLGQLARLDPVTAALQPSIFLGEKLTAIAVDNKADKAVALADKDKAFIINLLDKTSVEVTLPAKPKAVGIDESRHLALIGLNKQLGLRFLDLATQTLLPEAVAFDTQARAIAVDSSRGLAVVVVKRKNQLLLVDIANRQLLAPLSIPGEFRDVAIHRGRGLAYLVNQAKGTGEVVMLDLATRAVTGTIAVSKDAESIAIDEALDLAVVAIEDKNKLEVIDLKTNQIIATHLLSKHPRRLALNPITHAVVVTAKDSDQIALLDLATQTLTANFAALDKPLEVAISVRFNQALVIVAEKGEIVFIQLPNPLPVLTEIVPPDVTAPAPAVALLAIGKRFIDAAPGCATATTPGCTGATGSKVYLDNQPLVTRWKDPEHLEADVPLDVLKTAGIYRVKVVTPAPGGGESQSLSFTVQNPVPVLSAIAPAEVPSKKGDQTIVLTGSKFVPMSEVFFGAQKITTNYLSATQLTAVITGALLNSSGVVPITVFNPGPGGGSSGFINLTVRSAGPVISSFSPTSGPVGSEVTIIGENFDALSPGSNQVRFNGVLAVVAQATATQLKVIVPLAATSGPISVANATGTGISAAPFTVVATEDFNISVAPNNVKVPLGGNGNALIRLTSTGLKPYQQLIDLTVTGLPAGVEAAFGQARLSILQPVILTLKGIGAAPAGTYNVTVEAKGLSDGRVVARTHTFVLEVLATGTTTLSGRVSHADDRPFAGAIVRLGSESAVTNEAGQYRFINPALRGDQVILIDGHTNNTPAIEFPSSIVMPVRIVDGQENLALTSYLQGIDTGKFTAITPGQAAIVTTPEIPNFALKIPAGATLTGWDGRPIDKINVRTVTVDRLPIRPLPEGVNTRTVYLYYFFRPGGATPSQPIPVVMNNDTGALPGEKVDLWYYDESPAADPTSNQWRIMGQGTVSEDGKSIVSDPGVGIPKFCCGATFPSPPPPPPPPGGDGDCNKKNPSPKGGNPVDLASGIGSVFDNHSLGIAGLFPVNIGCHYNSMTATIGPFGRGTYFNYNWQARPTTQAVTLITPDGIRYNLARDTDGVFRATEGRAGAFGIQATLEGNLIRVRLADGTQYEFPRTGAANQQLTAVTDPNGNRIALSRDAQGRVAVLTDARGRLYQFGYSGTLITQVTDPVGRILAFGYDANSRLTEVTDPLGQTTRYAYDANHRVVQKTDARGAITQYNYDANGRTTEETLPDGSKYQFAYTVAGGTVAETRMTDPNGNVTTYRFNGQGYETKRIDALGRVFTKTVDYARNLVFAETDPLGRVTRYTYDNNGNRTSIRDPDGNITLIDYDPLFNKPIAITNALGHATTLLYDSKGNIKSLTNAEGETTAFTYTAQGKLQTLKNALGHTSTFAYDADGNLIESQDPLNRITRNQYDSANRLIETVNAQGHATRIDYDALDRLNTLTDALNQLTNLTYDKKGNLLTVTNPQGAIIETNAYDLRNRLTARKDALARSTTYTYDGNNNLKSATDRKGQVTHWTYDALNRPIRRLDADGRTTDYVYDLAGNVSQILDSHTGEIRYTYDNLNRLTSETSDQGVLRYTYDPIGRLTERRINGGDVTTYTYDKADRLTSITYRNQTVTHTYDRAGRLTSRTLPNGITQTYAYNDADEPLSITYKKPDGTVIDALTYTYDLIGNRLQKGRTNGGNSLQETPFTATYDAQNRMLTYAGHALTYDPNGNLTQRNSDTGPTTYTWDARNQLTQITGPNGTASFKYDALGRRIQKTINGVTTTYLYDGPQAIAELQGSSVGTTYLTGLQIDEVLARYSNTNRTFLTDALGSVLSQTDESGTIKTNYTYSPFGETQTTGDASDQPYQYTARENDNTGLYYYRARYYDPQLKRFVSEDPIGLEGGWNLYAYVLNNPLRYTDPTGLLDPSTWVAPAVETVTAVSAATVTSVVAGIGALFYPSPTAAPSCEFGPPGACAPAPQPQPTCHTKADCEEAFRIQWSICSRLQGEARRKCQQNATNLLAQCLQSATD